MVLLTHLKPEVIETVRKLILDDDQLQQYMEIFDKEISRGLDIETCEEATVKSIITHVNKLPSGKEEGQFLGLDFSGPTIKVMLVKLQDRECTITRKLYDIPPKYMKGNSEKLFDFIAKSIVDFLKGVKLKMLRIPLGVTFGFPIEQTSLQDCKLLRWTKGFQCNDLIDSNIFLRLKDSIRKFPELKRVYVIGILNDAVSVVLASAWQDPSCLIGLVAGTGASICYAEKAYRVTKYEAETFGVRYIYINMESADLGEDGCLEPFLSEFDTQLDEESKNPRKQMNDKLISTAFFGEVARLALIRCIEKNLILGGEVTEAFAKKNSLTLELMMQIESDPDTDHKNCKEALSTLGYDNATDEDCFQVQFVCRCAYRRSANLVAAQMATIINRINTPSVTIAADGELITKYPNYKWYFTKKLRQLKSEDCEFQIKETQESGLGPAVMAALYGEEVMNRDEKFRRLPGFPMDKCHFRKTGKCLNPDCCASHPCDISKVNPMMKSMKAESKDLLRSGCDKKKNGPCKGYDRM